MADVRKGQFVGADAEHPASGDAILSASKVDFQNYDASDAPDPVVYLTTDGDISTGMALGPLPQGSRDFSLAVPAGEDTTQFNTVSVHCREFNVGLASAPLT
jgi:hypothetical protein